NFCLFSPRRVPTDIYTLSLHDALPIYAPQVVLVEREARPESAHRERGAHDERVAELLGAGEEFLHRVADDGFRDVGAGGDDQLRSEEHTSELQSRENLVCRLLLEKKKY